MQYAHKAFFEAQLWSVASVRTWKGTSKRETRRKNWIQVEIDQPSEVENITAAVRSAWDMAKAGAEFDGHCINRLKYFAILAMASDLCIFIFIGLADA